eukprot:IDg21745t1
MGVGQLNYLLRTVPPTATKRGARLYDSFMHDALNELTGGTMPRETFSELQLPVRALDDTVHTFGVGLTSAVSAAPAAYLASVTQTLPLVTQIVGPRPDMALSERKFACQAHKMTSFYVRQGEMPPLEELETGTTSITQKFLTTRINRKTWETTPLGDLRTRAFRATLELPGAKDWINARPSTSLHTYVPNNQFRAWLRFYCRIPIRNPGEATCTRPGCSAPLDLHGDHLLVCPHSSLVGSANVTTRHNRQVRLLADDLRSAARNPVIEPRQREGENTRADIRATGRAGGDDIIDVSIVHPFVSEITQKRTLGNPGTIVHSAYNKKVTKHTPLLRNQTGGSIVPIIFAVSGGWDPRSHEYAHTIVRETSSRTDWNRSAYTALFFQRHAIRLLASNAAALTHDPIE